MSLINEALKRADLIEQRGADSGSDGPAPARNILQLCEESLNEANPPSPASGNKNRNSPYRKQTSIRGVVILGVCMITVIAVVMHLTGPPEGTSPSRAGAGNPVADSAEADTDNFPPVEDAQADADKFPPVEDAQADADKFPPAEDTQADTDKFPPAEDKRAVEKAPPKTDAIVLADLRSLWSARGVLTRPLWPQSAHAIPGYNDPEPDLEETTRPNADEPPKTPPPPEQPPAKPEKAPQKTEPFTLAGILTSEVGNFATINKQMVSVGDEIDGARVISIDIYHVVLEKDGKRLLLRMKSDDSK